MKHLLEESARRAIAYLDGLPQRPEPYCRHFRQQLTLVGKVLVRRRVADAGPASQLAQGELPVLLLLQDLQRRIDQCPAEIAMVIGASAASF